MHVVFVAPFVFLLPASDVKCMRNVAGLNRVKVLVSVRGDCDL